MHSVYCINSKEDSELLNMCQVTHDLDIPQNLASTKTELRLANFGGGYETLLSIETKLSD